MITNISLRLIELNRKVLFKNVDIVILNLEYKQHYIQLIKRKIYDYTKIYLLDKIDVKLLMMRSLII